jgi:hypothetical protein
MALSDTGIKAAKPKAAGLNRDLKSPFGSASYVREVLVAELCSVFTRAALGIVPSVRHADYIGAWLEVLLLSPAPTDRPNDGCGFRDSGDPLEPLSLVHGQGHLHPSVGFHLRR